MKKTVQVGLLVVCLIGLSGCEQGMNTLLCGSLASSFSGFASLFGATAGDVAGMACHL